MSVEAAVIQFAPATDTAANLETIRGYVAQAAEQGADIAVLPEYATYAKFGLDETYAETAEPLDGPSVSALRQLTQDHEIVVWSPASTNQTATAGFLIRWSPCATVRSKRPTARYTSMTPSGCAESGLGHARHHRSTATH